MKWNLCGMRGYGLQICGSFDRKPLADCLVDSQEINYMKTGDKNKMKMKVRNKALAGLMVLMTLVVCCTTGWAAGKYPITTNDPYLLQVLSLPADVLYEYEQIRSLTTATYMLSVVALEDYTTMQIMKESLETGVTYIAIDGSQLVFLTFTEVGTAIGRFHPELSKLTIDVDKGVKKINAKSVMDDLQRKGNFSSYYEVKNSHIKEQFQEIANAYIQ